MAVEALNSNDIAFSISTNTVTPAYKEIVCGTDITLDGSVDVTTTSTKCGPVVSVSVPAFTATASGAANITPGGSEISATELMTIFQNTSDVLIKLAHRTDATKYYRQGIGKVTSYTEDAPESGQLTFDIEVAFTGLLDVTS